MPRLLYLVPLLLFSVIAAYVAVPILQGKDPGSLPSVLIDKPAPRQSLPPLLAGKPGIDRTSLTGEVRLINFFASWCIPCRAEHPTLMQIAETQAVPLYGINYKDKVTAAREWLTALGDPFERIGRDRDGRAAIDWGVYGVPETYVLDHDGQIRHRHVGPLTKTVLDTEILPLVQRLRAERQ